MLSAYIKMADDAIDAINIESEWAGFTEAQLDDELKKIQEYTQTLEREKLLEFQECVQKYMPHTIVSAKRWRERKLRPVTASWRWLKQQHRKNLAPSPKK